jgi:hypothetical protein
MADSEDDFTDNKAEQSEFDDLMGKSLEEILEEGRKALFARLVGKCRLGTASHQEMAILRNILRDNGLTLGLTLPDSTQRPPIREPLELPDFETPEYLQ